MTTVTTNEYGYHVSYITLEHKYIHTYKQNCSSFFGSLRSFQNVESDNNLSSLAKEYHLQSTDQIIQQKNTHTSDTHNTNTVSQIIFLISFTRKRLSDLYPKLIKNSCFFN